MTTPKTRLTDLLAALPPHPDAPMEVKGEGGEVGA